MLDEKERDLMPPKRVTDDEVIDAYRNTGSVWRAGKQLGICGQSVHERLVAVGYPMARRNWTAAEFAEMETLATAGLPIGEIARRLGRPYYGVAIKMSRSGIPAFRNTGPRKIPRGAGYDKQSVLKHLRALEAAPDTKVTRYARSQGLNVDTLVGSFQKHFPERWDAYMVAHHGDIERRVCPYCGAEFIPANGKQTYCTRKCASARLRDDQYFGGRRREATGISTGTCQLCGRQHPSLQVHHVIGKENDPENNVMVAVCPGCHRLIGIASRHRTLIDNRTAWESLISLAWLEAHGKEIADLPASERKSLYVEVTIEFEDDPEDDETGGE